MGVTRKGHAGVSETDRKIAMNTGGMSHSKTENTDRSIHGTRQNGGDQPGPV